VSSGGRFRARCSWCSKASLRRVPTGKDVIVTLCGLYNREEVLNAAVEFTGPGVASLSMDARLTIANMSTEWGTLVGWFPVDEITLGYLEAAIENCGRRGHAYSPREI